MPDTQQVTVTPSGSTSANLFDHRRLNLSPELCVCVLSYKRLDLLRTTLSSIITHLEGTETDVAYEIAWVDNGSDEAERQALARDFKIEKALMLGTNYGIAYGFNSLFFRLCAAPYFLTLEEDWEFVGARVGAGRTALRDAMSVLRHDASLSGVFLRPDTLDQFLTRGPWQRTASNVEYAAYCLDRGAEYLWGPYSNGPGVYDRSRLAAVGRQFGEPGDAFPDPASEGNYCYRVGAAGLCSAILRVVDGCDGVDACNRPLFRHIGDERSHELGKGRQPDVRWLLYGSNRSADPSFVALREHDIDPTPYYIQLLLGGAPPAVPADGGATISLLVAAPRASADELRAAVRGALGAARAPQLVQLVWLLPAAGGGPLAEACAEEAARLGGGDAALACVAAPAPPAPLASAPRALAEDFRRLAERARGALLLLCPRPIVGFERVERVESEEPAPQRHLVDGDGAWDEEMRALYSGDGDVRHFSKDQVLLVQGAPEVASRPATHALVHREVLQQLGYFAPPVGRSALLLSLYLQHVFAALGRYRRLARVRLREAPPAEGEADAVLATEQGLRRAFDATAALRTIDTHRLQNLRLALLPKSRTAMASITELYGQFAKAFNGGELADAWVVLAELQWSMVAIDRSADWDLRAQLDAGGLRETVLNLQERVLGKLEEAQRA